MSTPCVQKENIDKLFSLHDQKVVKLHDMEIRQIEILSDVKTMRQKIENEMAPKIEETHDVVTRLEPIISHHDKVVNNIESTGWWVSRVLLAAFIGVLFWAIGKGFVPKV